MLNQVQHDNTFYAAHASRNNLACMGRAEQVLQNHTALIKEKAKNVHILWNAAHDGASWGIQNFGQMPKMQ